eukprot:COSAG02_NODE_6952_length_3266_cov_7.514683_2_plen_57_part_00
MMRLTFHDRVLRLQIHLGEKQAACDAVMDSLQPGGNLKTLFHTPPPFKDVLALVSL